MISIIILLYATPFFLLPPLFRWAMSKYDKVPKLEDWERKLERISKVPLVNLSIFLLAVFVLSVRAIMDLAILLLDKNEES